RTRQRAVRRTARRQGASVTVLGRPPGRCAGALHTTRIVGAIPGREPQRRRARRGENRSPWLSIWTARVRCTHETWPPVPVAAQSREAVMKYALLIYAVPGAGENP